jgi:Tfp pilus assembly protein FimT
MAMKMRGFTLLELLITSSLLISLSLIGVASYTYLLKKNEQQTLIDGLRSAIQYSRLQAIILGKPVYLSALNNSPDWSSGMRLSIFKKQTNQMESIYQWQWNYPHWDLAWEGLEVSHKIRFSTYPGQGISNGNFVLINKDTKEKTTLILNRLGRIRISNNLSQLR